MEVLVIYLDDHKFVNIFPCRWDTIIVSRNSVEITDSLNESHSKKILKLNKIPPNDRKHIFFGENFSNFLANPSIHP